MDANRNTLEAGHRNGDEAFCEGDIVAQRWDFGRFGLFKSWWALGDEGDVECLTKRGRWGGDLIKLGD